MDNWQPWLCYSYAHKVCMVCSIFVQHYSSQLRTELSWEEQAGKAERNCSLPPADCEITILFHRDSKHILPITLWFLLWFLSNQYPHWNLNIAFFLSIWHMKLSNSSFVVQCKSCRLLVNISVTFMLNYSDNTDVTPKANVIRVKMDKNAMKRG